MLRTVIAAVMLLCGAAMAQTLDVLTRFGIDYVNADQLAQGLGTVATRLGSSAVIRSGSGILTVFEGEQNYLWQAAGQTGIREGMLAAPTFESDGGLWLPVSLIAELGGTVSGVVVVMPDRTRLLLGPGAEGAAQSPATAGVELVPLGGGVEALRLQAGGQSLLLVDLGLLSLAQPAERSRLDGFNAGIDGYRPLYFVLAASEATEPALELTVSQSGVTTRLNRDSGLVLLAGDPASVAPGSPLSGVALLPATTNLFLPLLVQWQEQNAETVFRR